MCGKYEEMCRKYDEIFEKYVGNKHQVKRGATLQ